MWKMTAPVIVLALSAAAPSAGSGTTSFDRALSEHLRAVTARDLPALERTITHGSSLYLVLPDGRRLETRAAFVEFHRAWFRERGWTMSFEPVSRLVGTDLAVATMRTKYDDVVNGKPYHSENWLTLTFRRRNGAWLLVQDQNTRAVGPAG